MSLTVGSLFSGIGGLDLGLERAGMNVIWQSEIDPYACRVLSKHWPEVVNHGDIKRIDWNRVERPDVICGGYPCQPFSNAGKRKGEKDPRHLWPYVRESISRLRPRYAILENVRGHLSMGGLSVIGDLANLGYCAEWRLVSAASVGAHHRRDRLIIVAYPDNAGSHRAEIYSAENREQAFSRAWGCREAVGNTISTGRQRGSELQETEPQRSGFNQSSKSRGWRPIWEPEPNVGRVANGVPHRMDRLRGLGNAVVPQVAETIGRLVVNHAETV